MHLTDEVETYVRSTALSHGISAGDVVEEALTLYRAFNRSRQKGETWSITRQDGTRHEILAIQ
jgi:hypothetical protein